MDIKNKEQWEDHFLEACQNGAIEDVRHLCQKKYLDLGWADIHAHDEKGFRWACDYGQLEVIQYLLTSPELIEAGHTFSDLHARNEEGFRWACSNGHLEVVKYLLTSPELIEAGHSFANLHAIDEQGFRWACENGYLEVVKYLLTSPELS